MKQLWKQNNLLIKEISLVEYSIIRELKNIKKLSKGRVYGKVYYLFNNTILQSLRETMKI